MSVPIVIDMNLSAEWVAELAAAGWTSTHWSTVGDPHADDAVVMAVPSHGFRSVLTDASGVITDDTPIVSLSKGVEQGTKLRMTEVVADVLGSHDPGRIGVLTGGKVNCRHTLLLPVTLPP